MIRGETKSPDRSLVLLHTALAELGVATVGLAHIVTATGGPEKRAGPTTCDIPGRKQKQMGTKTVYGNVGITMP